MLIGPKPKVIQKASWLSGIMKLGLSFRLWHSEHYSTLVLYCHNKHSFNCRLKTWLTIFKMSSFFISSTPFIMSTRPRCLALSAWKQWQDKNNNKIIVVTNWAGASRSRSWWIHLTAMCTPCISSTHPLPVSFSPHLSPSWSLLFNPAFPPSCLLSLPHPSWSPPLYSASPASIFFLLYHKEGKVAEVLGRLPRKLVGAALACWAGNELDGNIRWGQRRR